MKCGFYGKCYTSGIQRNHKTCLSSARAVLNAATATAIKVGKAKSTEKIDGAIALIMVLDRALRCGQGKTIQSVYEERGISVL